MTNYPITADKIEYPQILIYLPYIKIQVATLISLIGYDYHPVETSGEYGYNNYFKKRWEEGKTFINLEQDIVPYPGAIKALWDCPKEWCVYDFHLACHWARNLENEKVGVPIGCVKISSSLITKTVGIWDDPVEWVYCEQNLTKKLVDAGFKAHQHHPSVVNANPVLLGKEYV